MEKNLEERILKGEDVNFDCYDESTKEVRNLVLKNGSPLTNANMIKAIRNSDIPKDHKVYLEHQHYTKILESKDKKACLECYRLSNVAFGRALEVLNDKTDMVYFKIYLQEKMKNMTKSNKIYQLNKEIVSLSDLYMSRKFLANLTKVDCDEDIRKNCWLDNLRVFEKEMEGKNLLASNAIWYLINCPSDLKIPNDTFKKLENIVLESKNGSYNLFFIVNYPNTNFRAHEKAILDSKCGITINQFAREFSVHYARDFKKREENRQLANIPDCAKAMVNSDSDTAIYVFAQKFGTQCSPEILQKMFTRLAKSKNKTCRAFGKSAIRKSKINQNQMQS